jgi:hypothetical protein
LRTMMRDLAQLRTPEGVPLPPNTLAELQRDLERGGLRPSLTAPARSVLRFSHGRDEETVSIEQRNSR